MEVTALFPSKVYQSPGMFKSQSVGTISSLQKEGGQKGPFVDRGVGPARFVRSSSSSNFTTDFSLNTDSKVCVNDIHFLFTIQIYFSVD